MENMERIKLSKMEATFDKYAGRQASFITEHKEFKLKVNGQLQRNDKQYWFVNGTGKIVVERKTSGSMISLKGTYKVISVRFLAGDSVLAEFEIPAKGKFQFKVS